MQLAPFRGGLADSFRRFDHDDNSDSPTNSRCDFVLAVAAEPLATQDARTSEQLDEFVRPVSDHPVSAGHRSFSGRG